MKKSHFVAIHKPGKKPFTTSTVFWKHHLQLIRFNLEGKLWWLHGFLVIRDPLKYYCLTGLAMQSVSDDVCSIADPVLQVWRESQSCTHATQYEVDFLLENPPVTFCIINNLICPSPLIIMMVAKSHICINRWTSTFASNSVKDHPTITIMRIVQLWPRILSVLREFGQCKNQKMKQ